MRFTHSARYDAAPADVLAMLTDTAFRKKAAMAQGATSADVSTSGSAVTLDLVQPNTDIPAFARAFAGETTRSIISEVWTANAAGHTAEFTVDTPGKPASIRGVRRLAADGSGTLDTWECEAKAKLPLIGGKIEKLIATKFTEGLNAEHDAAVAWLAGNR